MEPMFVYFSKYHQVDTTWQTKIDRGFILQLKANTEVRRQVVFLETKKESKLNHMAIFNSLAFPHITPYPLSESSWNLGKVSGEKIKGRIQR